MKRFLALTLVAVLLIGLVPMTSAAALTQYATVVGGWLRLRSSASFSGDNTIASYYTGTQVKILSVSGSWYRVETPDGKTGYMYSNYLSVNGGGVTPSGANATVVSANGLSVRLRNGPGTGYRVIRSFAVGTRAEILKSGSYWSHISIGGYTGYMMSQFLSVDGSTPTPTPVVGDATIWSANGYGVRLRSGPGTGYTKIGVYSVGTQVKIITKGAVWDYIQVGSRYGYMMNEFLIYNTDYKITKVTLNNLNPIVGTTLTASITPTNATATYSWVQTTRGGVETVVGTGSSYVVASTDIDCTLKVKVTGTGSYSGSATSAATAYVGSSSEVTAVTLNTTAPVVGDVIRAASITPAGATVNYSWLVNGTGSIKTETYTVAAGDVGKTIQLVVTGKGSYTGTASSALTAAVQQNGIVTGVTIANVSRPGEIPAAGDSIKAVPTPGAASVTYSWIVSGNTYTSESLTVDKTWAGQTISLSVTGKDHYTGSASTSVTVGAPSLTLTAPTFTDAQLGYTQPAAQFITVGNSGSAKANVTKAEVTGSSFIITNRSGVVNAASTNSNTWAVQPKANLAVGAYSETITLTYDNGATATTAVTFNVVAAAAELSVANVSFGEIAEGDAAPGAQNIVIRNTGRAASGAVTVTVSGTAYTIGGSPTAAIAAGSSATVTIQPTATAAGTYNETITATDGTVSTTATVSFAIRARATLTASGASASADEGYTPTGIPVTIAASGADVTLTNVAVDNSNFTVNSSGSSVIAAGASDSSWIVTPIAGLTAGSYSTTVSFSYQGSSTPATATVSFTVSATPAVSNLVITNEGNASANVGATFGVAYTNNGTKQAALSMVEVSDTANFTATDYGHSTVAAGASDAWQIKVNDTTPAGTYPVTVTITYDGKTVAGTYNVTVSVP